MITIDRSFLKRFALFENFENQDFDSILGMMIERTYERGKTIIVENEIGSEVFLLLDGEIEILQRMTLDNNT
ncbi:MAG: cyclic nucleotide-binding domain-containing protein, partial [bacterium]|nr:cyclic nucleotide-binding domain-containing protein [bacterium]